MRLGFLRTTALCLALVLVASTATAGPSVLLIWDTLGNSTPFLKTALENAGMTVTYSATSETAYNGANPSPVGFDAVIHLNGTTFNTDMPLAGQNALVSYVQNGGGFLHSEWNAFEIGEGRMANMRDLTLLDRTSGANGPFTVTDVPGAEGHPVLANVPSPFAVNSAYNVGNAHAFGVDPVSVLMRDGNGNDAVLVRDFGAGRVVGFHHAGNFANNPTFQNVNIQQLYIDGVRWARVPAPGAATLGLLGLAAIASKRRRHG